MSRKVRKQRSRARGKENASPDDGVLMPPPAPRYPLGQNGASGSQEAPGNAQRELVFDGASQSQSSQESCATTFCGGGPFSAFSAPRPGDVGGTTPEQCPCSACAARSSDETRFTARPAAFVDHEQLLKLRNFSEADWDVHAAKQRDGVVTYEFRHRRRRGERATWCSSPAVPPVPVDMRAYRSEFDDPTTAQRVALAEEQCERIAADLEKRFAECGEQRRAVETLEASVPNRQTRSGTASESARAETERRERERDEAKEKLADLEKLVEELRVNSAEAEDIVASMHQEAAEETLVAEEAATMEPSDDALSKQVMCAAMSTGMSYETLSAFSEAAGFGHIGKTSFYKFQKVFKVKTMEMYRETTEAALDRARNRKVFVATDAQYDTSRNGYYCVVTVIDQDTSMVLHQSVVTRVDEELQEKHNGSTVMSEVLGTRRVLGGEPARHRPGLIEKLRTRGAHIDEVVHDNNIKVDTVLRELLPNAVNSKDLWHETKGKIVEPTRALVASTNDAEIKALVAYYLKKRQDSNLPGSFGAMLKNHFYHAAAACFAAGETDPMHLHARFVTTFFRHVCGDHSLCCGKCDPGGDFPAIKRDGAAYASLVALLKDFRSLKHLGFFMRARESYLVEALHTVIIKYAPKRIFWPKSFQHRVALAVIDWNCNQGRLCVREAERRHFDGANCGNNRARARVVKELEAKDYSFRHEILARAVYGDARHYDSTAYDSTAACAPRWMAFQSSREINVLT